MCEMPKNRCFECGRYVGERFAGYERDRTTNRGRLTCEACHCRGADPDAISDDSRMEYRVDANAYEVVLAEFKRRHTEATLAGREQERQFQAGVCFGMELAVHAGSRVEAVIGGRNATPGERAGEANHE